MARQSEDRGAHATQRRDVPGKWRTTPEPSPLGRSAERGGVACLDEVTNECGTRSLTATDGLHPDATQGLSMPQKSWALSGRQGSRGGAAGIVTRMCRDAAGGSVARCLLPRDRARPPEDEGPRAGPP